MKQPSLPMLATVVATAAAAPCTTCIEGSISKPDQLLNIVSPIPIETCTDLNALSVFVDDSTEECLGIRMMGGLCGCPQPENACGLCPEGYTLQNPLKTLDPSSSEVLQTASAGLDLNCAFVDSYVKVASQSDDFCNSTLETFQQDCTCMAVEVSTPTSSPVAFEPCTLCPDGSPMLYPDNPIPVKVPDIPVKLDTCRDVAAAGALMSLDADICFSAIQVFASFCGCPTLVKDQSEDTCILCPDGTIPEPYNQFYLASEHEATSEAYGEYWDNQYLTCGFSGIALARDFEPGSEFCFQSQLRREMCGCPTHPKMPPLIWSRRVVAALSMLASAYIASSVLRDPAKRDRTYELLMLMISCADLIGSSAFLFDHFLLPADNSIPFAVGNRTTCKAQGVLLQLGFGSALFNLLLAAYFWLMVAQGWKEYRMKKIRRILFPVLIVAWTALSFGGIPFYSPLIYSCHIGTPPIESSWMPLIFFVFLPVGLSHLGTIVFTILLFRAVYKLEQSSTKWRMQIATKGDSMMEKVFWRCFWYLVAFSVPWPLYYASFWMGTTEENYWFSLTLQICVPMQGVLNALIYYQRSSTPAARRQRSSQPGNHQASVSSSNRQPWQQTTPSGEPIEGSSYSRWGLKPPETKVNANSIDMAGRMSQGHATEDEALSDESGGTKS